MKDYGAMSDFEINFSVAKIWITDAVLSESKRELTSAVFYGDFESIKTFDPCKSWADAGPIIEKNKIDINWSMQCGDVRQPYARNSDAEAIGHVGYIHDNPLRAAMIVFLMMQESK